MLAHLMQTCKTHKPPSEVECRAIHAAPHSSMLGAMQWVKGILRQMLKRYSHLLRDTDNLQSRLDAFTFDADVRAWKFDIKDFFMSGKQRELITSIITLLDVSMRKPFSMFCGAILTNQLVCIEEAPEHVWRVIVGNGQGLLHSSEVSDASFLAMSEVTFALNLNICNKLGIRMYNRSRDDVLVISGPNDNLTQRFFDVLGIKSKFFKITVEGPELDSIDYLDLRIFKDSRFRHVSHFDYELYKKPTTIYMPFSVSSVHPPFVHCSWPLNNVQRIKKRCCNSLG